MEAYAIYLRKSRADIEAESHGEGETLLRHEKTLLDLARKLNLNVTEIYREIVSGETIAARPVMQLLLSEVEQGKWKGVLVMEVERLARGDTIDQGIVSQAFKFSNTKIITPVKTYDPSNEFDEEYFEFGLFMSRREFKTINRRIQRGRIASVKEGKYISSVAPYGYERIKLKSEKGYSLKVNEEQAKVVRMIYNWYVNGDLQPDGSKETLGCSRIAKKLDSMSIKPMLKATWSRSSIKDILENPVYIGKIRWQHRKEVKQIKNNIITTTRPNADEYILADGIHDAIIEDELWTKAQEIMKKRGKPPVSGSKVLKNPLAGIVYCGKCGTMMTRLGPNSHTAYDSMKCPNTYCDNISSPLYVVENSIIDALGDWLINFKFQWSSKKSDLPYEQSIKDKEAVISDISSQITKLRNQLDKTFELLEQEVYSTEEFQNRRKKITEQLNSLEDTKLSLVKELNALKEQYNNNDILIPKIEHLLEVYNDLEDATSRNELLKEVLEKADYTKTEPNKKGKRENRNFTVDIFPKTSQV
ncbi:recombinase family protein [Anaerocolumna sp. AGMB13025]|uniref:recombinase family protein n=1 Tax=Anaerocolumna sp. AGMB13025 TaxID=3039116 RepID=UPI00241D7F62|nr:recombinase family protein [Anaerocolumna sp. AGMB13025]WFR55401.1 recombinase family protein [Anaerocolumna sp. AGMB13025]